MVKREMPISQKSNVIKKNLITPSFSAKTHTLKKKIAI